MQPFTIAIPDAEIEDLQRRLENVRWPDQAPGDPWTFGIEREVMQYVVDYWRNSYDWRAREARMNAYPNFITTAEGEQVHFLHVRSSHANATPMVLTHGWPGSFVEFLDVIEPLTQPELHGGTADDAFHLVIPSMPGYGFSGPTTQPNFHVNRVTDAIASVMEQLSYDRYIAQGGDWGAIVTRRFGEAYPERLYGIHVNMMFAFPSGDDPDPMAGVTEKETERMAAAGARIADGTGYMAIQSTKPQTLSYGLNDSPTGLAAWILEKFQVWSDLDNESFLDTFGIDRVLDNVSVYWFTQTAGSAARLYAESQRAGNGAAQGWSGKVEVPTGHALYPYELLQTPRAWAEKKYNIVHWSEQPRGGHFAAFERPQLFVDDLRQFKRALQL